MPELPEVETIRQGLEKYLVLHIVKSIVVNVPKMFQGDKKNLIGAKVKSVVRFGKGLVINLSNNYSLAIHIKMTGQLVYTDRLHINKTLPNKWTRVIFHLDKGAALFYNDIRKFGWMKLVKSNKLKEISFFKDLGPEFPLRLRSGQVLNASNKVLQQTNLTLEKFREILSKSNAPVKSLIMDQNKMSGVGNIYANDGLYLAKISPKRRANSLTKQEVKTLFQSVISVLKKGIAEGGASEVNFINVLGQKGSYQKYSLVYGKKGEKCKRDGGVIQKSIIGGRGTFFCPICQN